MQELISKFSKREKTQLSLAVLLVMAALLDRAVLHPIIEKIKLFEEDIKKTEYEMSKNMKILEQKQRIEKEEKKYSSFSKQARTEEEEMAVLLREIENVAKAFGVYLVDLKPAGVTGEGFVKKFMVNLVCEADMEQLISFIYSIENAETIMRIGSFTITPKSKGNVAQCEVLIHKIIIP